MPTSSHHRNHIPADFRSVNGWGADLDPKNRPSYPKEYPSDVMTARGPAIPRQVPRQRIHMSNEYPDLTPVFGTSAPPRGLSGKLRDYAFEYGEATNRHWVTLLLADRVDMIESMITSALRGRPDNIIAEKGWKANLKYSGEEQRRKMMVVGAVALGAIAVGVLLSQRSDR